MAKKTVLGEDADIYKKREPKKEKEKLKGLPFRKKIGYIKDYYLKAFLAIGIVAGVVIYMVYLLVRPTDDVILKGVAVNDAYDEISIQKLLDDFGKTIDYDPDTEDINIEDSLFLNAKNLDGNVQQKISVYTLAGTLDIMIATEDIFSIYAKEGFFTDLSEVLSEKDLAALSDNILFETRNAISEDDLSAGEEQIDTTTKHPYGVCLDNSTLYQSVSEYASYEAEDGTSPSFYIGIVNNTSQKDNAVAFIKYLQGLQ